MSFKLEKETRLEPFTDEELQMMLIGTKSLWSGWSQKPLSHIQDEKENLDHELTMEIDKRYRALQEKIERQTPRCKTCNQRIPKGNPS